MFISACLHAPNPPGCQDRSSSTVVSIDELNADYPIFNLNCLLACVPVLVHFDMPSPGGRGNFDYTLEYQIGRFRSASPLPPHHAISRFYSRCHVDRYISEIVTCTAQLCLCNRRNKQVPLPNGALMRGSRAWLHAAPLQPRRASPGIRNLPKDPLPERSQ